MAGWIRALMSMSHGQQQCGAKGPAGRAEEREGWGRTEGMDKGGTRLSFTLL